MQIILLRDVAGVGQKGALKKVSDGYAMNFLIPRRLAEMATSEKIAELNTKLKEAERESAKQQSLWKEYADRLKEVHVSVQMNANAHGQLYRQVPAAAIVDRLRSELGIQIPEESILIKQPIRHTGRVPIVIRLGSHQAHIELIVEKSK